MPPIKIDHVVSFSSEDSVHTANNILSADTSKKWKCHSPGEKQANVVLQLDKASQITDIDIGNEHSAYIEVLVSRSSGNEEFKVLLVTSAFMTPLEARQSQNINKVRMFTKDQLSKPESLDKWDRVKIVCTQPFNRHVQFGISFITLHSNISKDAETSQKLSVKNFLIRPESPDNLSAGALFAKRKEFSLDEKPSAAAAIRDATSSSSIALYGSPTCKPKLNHKDIEPTPKKKLPPSNTEFKLKDRNRNELFYTADEEDSNDNIDNIIKKKKEESIKKENGEKKRKNIWGMETDSPKIDTKKKKNDEIVKQETKKTFNKTPDKKKNVDGKDKIRLDTRNSKNKGNIPDSSASKNKNIKKNHEDIANHAKIKKAKFMKPFRELLNGVTVVISGIQNPDRANLRTMALSMGAKYKPDWDGTCTHLICAFPNTPKFNQVKGKGKIVKKSWLETCHKERKLLPWRRFALDKNDADKNESEDEIYELVVKDTHLPSTSSTKMPTFVDNNSDDEHKAKGSDTEERIAKILRKKKEIRVIKKKELQLAKIKEKNVNNSTNDSTDEELLNVSINPKNKTGKLTLSNNSKTQETQKIEISPKKENKTEKMNENPYNSGDTTDEESLNVLANLKRLKNKVQSPKISNCTKIDEYEADTEEETYLTSFHENGSMDVFHGEKIYVDQSLDEDKYTMLCKYIVAYNGKCVNDITGDIDVILTTKENSDTLKEVNKKAKCIDQEWLLQTHIKHKLIPINNYKF